VKPELEVTPSGEQGEKPKRPDLPTLPLRLRQTPGGYKAIDDAEGRLVTFVGMREDDRAWGEFLIKPVNAQAALIQALRGLRRTNHPCYCSTWSGGEHEPECEAATAALALVDGPQQETK
jgi:hypothetical protein